MHLFEKPNDLELLIVKGVLVVGGRIKIYVNKRLGRCIYA